MSNVDPYAGMKAPASNFVKWEAEGQSAEGVITSIHDAQDFNGNPIKEWTLRQGDGTEVNISIAQANLIRAVMEARPQVGEHIRVTFTGYRGKAKLFTLERFGAQPVAQAPAPAAAPPAQPQTQPAAPPAAPPTPPQAPAAPAPPPQENAAQPASVPRV